MTTACSNEIDSHEFDRSGFFKDGDPDPVWNWTDPKHCFVVLSHSGMWYLNSILLWIFYRETFCDHPTLELLCPQCCIKWIYVVCTTCSTYCTQWLLLCVFCGFIHTRMAASSLIRNLKRLTEPRVQAGITQCVSRHIIIPAGFKVEKTIQEVITSLSQVCAHSKAWKLPKAGTFDVVLSLGCDWRTATLWSLFVQQNEGGIGEHSSRISGWTPS